MKKGHPLFVRHSAWRSVGEQASIVWRPIRSGNDTPRGDSVRIQPPSWIDDRDTLPFLISIPSTKIPGDSMFIGGASSNTLQVEIVTNIGATLPECCLVLPNQDMRLATVTVLSSVARS